mgnify:FL=1
MRLKMLIVDDEPLICQGLAKTIPWQEVGIEVVDTAINGKKALEIMERETVDIVITDVNMPELDGIQLSRAIAERFSSVSIIMISGYDEFDYALQALRIGVEDYLLKPVDIDELMKLVNKVKMEMEEEKRNKETKDEAILRNYFSQQIFHLPNSSNLPEHIKIDSYAYRLLLMEKRNYYKSEQPIKLYKEWKPMIDPMDVSSISIEIHENQLLLIVYNQEGISSESLDCLSSELIASNEISLVISSEHHDLSHFATVYQELNQRLNFYRGMDKQLVLESEQLPSVPEYQLDKRQVNDLMDMVFQQRKQPVEKIVNKWFTDFQEFSLPLSRIKGQCLLILHSIKETGQDSIFEEIDFNLDEEIDLRIYNSPDVLRELLLADLNNMMDYVGRSTNSHWIIQQAKQYMEKNYQKDIKAVKIAEAHYITPNYFSMLFKQETGCNFSEYLNRIRINKAKELLCETSNKVFEIAEYVGYREYKYFVQVFKNFTGTTPTQFRKLHFIDK